MGRHRDLWLGTHVATVEGFRLSIGGIEAESACHRALRSADWTEQAADRFEVPNYLPGSEGEATAKFLDRITRGLSRRYTTRSASAPDGPTGADAEINAVWSARVIVRISLRERSSDATEVTLSGSGLPGLGHAMLRSALDDLRRSIEIQSGSTTPVSATFP